MKWFAWLGQAFEEIGDGEGVGRASGLSHCENSVMVELSDRFYEVEN